MSIEVDILPIADTNEETARLADIMGKVQNANTVARSRLRPDPARPPHP